MTSEQSTRRRDIAAIKSATMACWWPSRVNGERSPDWAGVRGELSALMNGAYTRGEFSSDMAEFDELARLYDVTGAIICEVCDAVKEGGTHPCSFARACSCWRGIPCKPAA